MISPTNIELPGTHIALRDSVAAFVPAPLPPVLALSDLQLDIAEASMIVGELRGVGAGLTETRIIEQPLIQSEAVYSSRIEGTIASAEQLAMFEADPGVERAEPSVREVSNYSRALRLGLQRLEELPVSRRLILEMHAELLRGVRGDDRRPGEFRLEQNYIGKPGTPIEEARYVPPPAAELSSLLDNFERYANGESTMPPVVDLALLHYQFEAIHPFADGNGRIGRLLLPLLLSQWDMLQRPLLHLSPYFEQHNQGYVDGLLRVSEHGDWNGWIRYFLGAVIHQGRESVETVHRLIELRGAFRGRVQTAGSSVLLIRLVDSLFENPAITIPIASRLLEITYPAAKRNVLKLVDAGVLQEVNYPGLRSRTFIAAEILQVTRTRRPSA